MSDYSKIICFDLEMCCWDGGERQIGEIISIGLVEMCLETGTHMRTAEFIVKPQYDDVSAFCTKLTGISQSQINKQGRPLEKVMETVKTKFGGDRKVYTAWGDDGNYLAKECDEKGFSSPIASHLNAALLYMTKHRHSGGQVAMKRAMNHYGLAFEGHQHNALNDATNMARLVHAAKLL